MLVKCVCENCGHSYLADDEARLACPRCGVDIEGTRNPSDIPDAPAGASEGVYDPYVDDGYGIDLHSRFDPQAPPPMYITGDRLARGLVFGSLASLLMAAVLGASLSAIRVAVPGALALILAIVGGPACRYGFGGRTTYQSVMRARVAVALAMILGVGGFIAGSWAIERWTGMRAEQAREDLDRGLRRLITERARTQDEGRRILLEQRIEETKRLQGLSNAQLEDYLWTQQGGIRQPLLAYGKLRAWNGPVIRLGTDRDPVELPTPAPVAILAAELVLAFFLAQRFVMPR